MTSPKFSVIIPSFNGGKFISTAITSVLEQTYPAFEIIVVDDGSTDNTKEIVELNFNKKIKYIYQKNQGVAAARNLGAKIARGDWLAFLDADDWYLPNRLADHARLIKNNKGIDFVTSDYEYRQDNGDFISNSMELHPSGQEILARNPERKNTISL